MVKISYILLKESIDMLMVLELNAAEKTTI